MIIASETYRQATELFTRLPVPRLCASSRKVYLSAMKRMMADEEIDPLRTGDARDTYGVRRAALPACTWLMLKKNLEAFDEAAGEGDRSKAGLALDTLEHIVERCGAAIDRDRPLERAASSFDCGPSRWTTSEGPHPRRGKGSKKHELKKLPHDWTDRIWRAAMDAQWKYLDALAVHILSPARPAEFVRGVRDGRDVEGIEIALEGDVLVIRVAPVKSHGGKYGTGETELRLDVRRENLAVAHLVRLCEDHGGSTVVSLEDTNPMRKALCKLGRKVFPDVDVTITGYLFRHQYIADLKATVGAGEAVAVAAGHCTDRTQSRYGSVQHGRRRPEFISATAKRQPNCGNVERARTLAAKRMKTQPNPASRDAQGVPSRETADAVISRNAPSFSRNEWRPARRPGDIARTTRLPPFLAADPIDKNPPRLDFEGEDSVMTGPGFGP